MNKINRFFKGLHRGQKGITGLETAIILIAFVTVASVLAYSVLSAGIFSSEKGKEAIYSGLSQASASMQVRGSVIALGTPIDGETPASITEVKFTLASVLQDASVDMTDTSGDPPANAVVINYTDSTGANVPNIGGADDTGGWTSTKEGTTHGISDGKMLDPNEQMLIDVTLPGNTLAAYSSFTLQIIPPSGAAITITRTLPGVISDVMDLN